MATGVFMFTDIEGSTRRWAEDASRMGDALAMHDALLRAVVGELGGVVVNHTGDGLVAYFDSALSALAAAVQAQRRLSKVEWPGAQPLLVRMAVHAGEASLREDGWFGPALNRCSRLMGIAHGGQILLSGAARALLLDVLPVGVGLRRHGSHRLRDLAAPEEVFEVLADGLRGEFPPLRSLDSFHGNLPSQLTTFYGRELETAEIAALLTVHRVVVLTGPGGMGKSRLSLAVGATMVDKYPDGVWWVELAPVSEPDAVVHAVGSALGLQPRSGATPVELTVEALQSSHCLLLLDNCEHLLAPAAALVSELVARCPHIGVLATSREALGVPGERVVGVRPLAIHTDAVALFTDRATAARAELGLLEDQLDVVREICRQLDGMPLAIELAAARLRSMSARELADRLDRRFRLLRADRAEPNARHGTLLAVVEWSYELLTDAERRLFQRLAVFAGSFDLTAAHALCAEAGDDELDTLDHLDGLVSRSLVQVEERRRGMRYSLLQTMRQFASDRWSEDDQARLRSAHMQHFATAAEASWEGMLGANDLSWLDWLADEQDNLRLAFNWARATGADATAVALTGNLVLFSRTFPLELWDWARQAAQLPDFERHPRANRLLQHVGWSHRFSGDQHAAMDCVRRALAIEERSNPEQDPGTYVLWGTVCVLVGDFEEAGRIHDVVEARTAPLGPRYALYRAWAAQADVYTAFERGVPTSVMAERASAAAATTRNARTQLLANVAVGVARAESDPELAADSLQDAAVLASRLQDANLASALACYLMLTRHPGDPLAAVRGVIGALDSFTGAGAPYGIRLIMREVLPVLSQLGEHDLVAIFDAAAVKLTIRPRACAAAREAALVALGPQAFEEFQRHGRAMSTEETDLLIRARLGKLLSAQAR